MAHYLETLGFLPEEVLAIHPEDHIVVERPRFPMVSTFRDASGVCISSALDGATGYRSQTMGITGCGNHRVAATQIIPGIALIEILDADDSLQQRLVVHVDDPHLYSGYQAGNVYGRTIFNDYRLGGVCLEISRTHKHAAAALDQPDQQVGAPESLQSFVPERDCFVVTPNVARLLQDTANLQEQAVISEFGMLITQLATRQNHYTGRTWVYVEGAVGLPGQTHLALALSLEQAAGLSEGDYLSGQAYLSGTTGLWDVGVASPVSTHMYRGTNTFELQALGLSYGVQSYL